jgi:hypothetical protein
MDVIELILHSVTDSSDTGDYDLWGEIYRTRPERPWDPSGLLYSVYRISAGSKVAGAWR